jgi:hypothetical protein
MLALAFSLVLSVSAQELFHKNSHEQILKFAQKQVLNESTRLDIHSCFLLQFKNLHYKIEEAKYVVKMLCKQKTATTANDLAFEDMIQFRMKIKHDKKGYSLIKLKKNYMSEDDTHLLY